MKATRRIFMAAVAGGVATWSCGPSMPSEFNRFVRYEQGGEVHFGGLDGETVYEIEGDLFGSRIPTGKSVPLADVKLLYPIEPTKVIALAGNYLSHIGRVRRSACCMVTRIHPQCALTPRCILRIILCWKPPPFQATNEPPAYPEPSSTSPSPAWRTPATRSYPEPFYKPITSLANPGDPIIPEGAQDVHYECEFVIVIGRKASKVSVEDAPNYILGYTAGNDVSERNWQNGSIDGPENKDMQWWRGKGADTFGPMGPAIAVGLDFEKSKIQTRLNGEVRQEQVLSDLIHKPAEVVSFISQAVTLLPGDVIFTGTPGSTKPMKAGDTVEVEIDGIGILSNPVQG